jgi:hypothetical protein
MVFVIKTLKIMRPVILKNIGGGLTAGGAKFCFTQIEQI